MHVRHHERHRTDRIGWLRAAVLGANDGIVSTASLVVGVAAAHGRTQSILVAGLAGLVAGAMSMAAGEYVSVRSQADTEQAELDRERAELEADAEGERGELTPIYVGRGLDPALATQVAEQLMAHDALGAHARDELGITETLKAAAAAGGLRVGVQLRRRRCAAAARGRRLRRLPCLMPPVAVASLVCLAVLGGLAARVGGARVAPGALRVTFWGALAMAITAGVGALFGTVA